MLQTPAPWLTAAESTPLALQMFLCVILQLASMSIVACMQDCPEDVLEAVALGVDLFDCSYPTQATANGYALSFPLREDTAAAAGGGVDADCGADDTKVNLWATQYRCAINQHLLQLLCFQ